MDINYELYKVFYHVATTLSFSEASRRLFISQSAVSQSIRSLEKKLNQKLFIRSTKKVKLTPAGELLLKHIEPAMNLIKRGEEQILDTMNLGQLHIAASDTICRYFLVPYLKRFHEMYPDVPIKVTNATSLACADLMRQGKVDLVFTNTPNSRLDEDSISRVVCKFKDVFVASEKAFSLKDKTIALKELTEYPILMLDRKSTTSEYLHDIFLKHQLELVPQIELSSNDLLMDLAKIGLGIAFVPDYMLSSTVKDIYSLKIKETIPERQIVVAVNTSLPQLPSTEKFLQLLPSL
ncbi:MAG: LysR family transcriptional regulator [Lachnospiraceae bacterium]|nr:LysR family transcriptional regulator [Lachnospiraceae bacterium]